MEAAALREAAAREAQESARRREQEALACKEEGRFASMAAKQEREKAESLLAQLRDKEKALDARDVELKVMMPVVKDKGRCQLSLGAAAKGEEEGPGDRCCPGSFQRRRGKQGARETGRQTNKPFVFAWRCLLTRRLGEIGWPRRGEETVE